MSVAEFQEVLINAIAVSFLVAFFLSLILAIFGNRS